MYKRQGDNVADETFASFLSKKKEEARLSNTKLARIANISAVYLGEIINGKKIPPDKKTQYALADALNLSYEDRVMSVSYTHLDVYKRQSLASQMSSSSINTCCLLLK